MTLVTLSPKQAQSILNATAPVNIWHGSVRSGKSTSADLAWLNHVPTAPRGRLWLIGNTLDTIYRNVLVPQMDLFPRNACPIKYTRGASTCRVFGREVEVVGAHDVRAENRIRGATAAGALVDEATLLPGEGYWNQLIARHSVDGARIFATTNPDNPTHWLKRNTIDRAAELGYYVVHFELGDNPSLSDAYIARLAAQNTGLFYKRNVLGLWVLAEGAVFDMWDADRHVIDTDPAEVAEWLLCIDYGTAGVFAAHLIAVCADRLVVAHEFRWDAVAEGHQMTDLQYVEWLRGKLADIDPLSNAVEALAPGARRPRYTVVDPSATSFIRQLHVSDWPSVRGADNAVDDGIRIVSSLLSAGRLEVHSRCTGLIGEMAGYVWDPKAAARGEDKPVKAADHSVDAVRYGVMRARQWWRHWLAADAIPRKAAA